MEYTKESVQSGPSRHGLGVFALRSFDSGDYIGPIEGQVVTDPDYGSEYGIDLGDDLRTLEPDAPFRYLNHSCQPNAELLNCDETGETVVWLEVVSPIQAGEPITIDYSWPADAAIRCECGTANCRGWIVAEEYLGEVTPAG